MGNITTKQRAELRKLANSEETIFQIGKNGINDNLIKQLDDALEARELIKIRVLQTSPVTAREAMIAVSERLGAEQVQVVGGRIVIYRESKNNKKIVL